MKNAYFRLRRDRYIRNARKPSVKINATNEVAHQQYIQIRHRAERM